MEKSRGWVTPENLGWSWGGGRPKRTRDQNLCPEGLAPAVTLPEDLAMLCWVVWGHPDEHGGTVATPRGDRLPPSEVSLWSRLPGLPDFPLGLRPLTIWMSGPDGSLRATCTIQRSPVSSSNKGRRREESILIVCFI
jgi:hypothetical protein